MLKKLSSVTLAALLCAGALSGCGGAANSGSSSASSGGTSSGASSEASSTAADLPMGKITLIMFGDESPRMQELMSDEFQELFKKEIHTEVELQYIPWGEYGAGGKIDLMIAAGEDFDAARTHSDWCAASVSKNYLQDLTEVAAKYLPDLKQSVSQEAFDSLTYGGKLYAIPMGNKPAGGHFSSVCVREDILKEVGMTDITSLEDLDKFVTLAKEKHPEMYATPDGGASAAYLLRAAGDDNVVATEFTGLYFNEDTGKFLSIADSDEFKVMTEYREKWYNENLTPKDMLTSRVGNKALFESGNFLFFRGSSGTTVLENQPSLQKAVSTAELKEYWMNPEKPKYKSMYTDYAWQVPAYSENADRVAMFVNLLQKNTEYVDMFTYGIKDKDYEIVDNKIHQLQSDELFYQWATFNTKISTFDEKFPSDFIETYKNWDNDAVKSKLVGFALNLDSIKSEKAKIDAVWAEYGDPLAVGFLPYDSTIEKLKSELDSAGFEKYITEIQKQFDDFLKTQA